MTSSAEGARTGSEAQAEPVSGRRDAGDTTAQDAARLLRHPAAPALTAAVLLAAGFVASVVAGLQDAAPPTPLLVVVCFSLLLCGLPTGRRGSEVPRLTRRALAALRVTSLTCLAAELAYFGAPLSGGVAYNEFGWPVIHHVAAGYWLLVLFGRRHKLSDLAVSLAIAMLLFNRQMALFSVLAFLMTTRMSARQIGIAALATVTLAGLVGGLRNQVLGVDVGALGEVGDLPYVDSLFFVYLYLTGPLYMGLGIESEGWALQLGAYWNTVPEWARLSEVFSSLPRALSFIAFYGVAALSGIALRVARIQVFRCFGWLVQCYCFFSFFSDVLISTPIIANLLIVALASRLYPPAARR